MSPAARKFLITFVTTLAALSVFAVVLFNRPKTLGPVEPSPAATDGAAVNPTSNAGATPNETPKEIQAPAAGGAPTAAEAKPQTPAGQGLVARAPNGPVPEGTFPASIGSLDPSKYPYRIEFSRGSAGVQSITFADFWKSAVDRNAARRHRADASNPLPGDDARYVLATEKPLFEGMKTFEVPVLAAHSLQVDDTLVVLFGNVWSEVGPGQFVSEIVDGQGTPRFRVDRSYEIVKDSYDLTLRQTVTNLGDRPAMVRWIQYGPADLAADPGGNIEVRRFHFGYLLSPERDKAQEFVITTGQMFEHAAVLKKIAANDVTLWRNHDAAEGKFGMSWYGTTSRYFSMTVHPSGEGELPPGSRGIGSTVETVKVRSNNAPVAAEVQIFSELHSGVRSLAPGEKTSFDIGVYAGPLDSRILGVVQPYRSLAMQQLIVYMLSSCCSFCTFAWLADFLAWFLGALHDYVVFDWGLAIIVLVIVVRTLLHPLMKSSQIKMQRFGKAMAELKPELDALQKRFKDEPQKIQAEQLRLYREKGVNPAGCVGGILPTFLQTPIWIALYAVLYFAFELRQQPAFFGIFEKINGWQFLGDLSRPDSFFLFPSPIDLGLFHLNGINLLPLLMGIVFFIQQKYMSPPTPNMTPEQEQQQKIMKVMMVVMFPVMLYAAPSGLTLYILTSTCIGIIESRMVKRHIEQHGLANAPKAKLGKDGKPKQDRLGKLYQQMLEKSRDKQQQANRRTFKDRE